MILIVLGWYGMARPSLVWHALIRSRIVRVCISMLCMQIITYHGIHTGYVHYTQHMQLLINTFT